MRTPIVWVFLFVQAACRYRLDDLMRLRRDEGDERHHAEIDEARDNADDEQKSKKAWQPSPPTESVAL